MKTETVAGRRRLAVLLAMLVAVMPFSVDAYLPAMPEMARALHADIHKVEQSLGVFIFGVALGQLLGGPLSDFKGRRRVALVGLGLYVLATVMLVRIADVSGLLWWRLWQAMGGSMATVIVAALVRDRFAGREAAQMFALIGIITMLAPLAAPMLGAALKAVGGWRLVFGFLALYGAAVWLLLWWRLPAAAPPQSMAGGWLTAVVGNYARVFRQPRALGFLFLQAFSFASMVVFLTESSFVYISLYGLSEHQYAWAFGANILTMMLCNRITAWQLRRTDAQHILPWGVGLQLCCNLSLTVLVWTQGLPPFAAVLGLIMLSVGSQGLIVANTQACYMAHFQAEGGSANAVLGTVQFLVAGLLAWLTTLAHNGSALVMPLMMLSASLCGLVLLWTFSRAQWRSGTN